ncbi:hypothetical protein TD95_000047 [Thielaviopsis punctulata]|uniref:Tyrosine--tRNA ligase n=1 Tax=Thielaviopsis punctulata TaxID=72032 RepID=A0A0F4Z6X9_9PEZI|nr:hypothetical protein TD95_000047 [Thielaviopsis punctulata]
MRPLLPVASRIGAGASFRIATRASSSPVAIFGAELVKARVSSGMRTQPGLRYVSTSHLKKKEQAAQEFAAQAEKIQKGEAKNVWDVFEERGLVKDVAGRKQTVKELLRIKRIGAYTGFDPTAQSLHVGHLMAIMPLFWLYFYGYPTVSLIGGATARIGDPTGRTKSRPNMTNAEISRNITKIHYQLERIWNNVEELGRKYGYPGHWAGRHYLWNNSMWLNKLPLYDLMKRVGRHIRIGPMMAKDTVKQKVESGEGMSFAEFSYPLLQGWDFWHMYSKIGVQMQIGGSDQYGNITMGCEVLKSARESEEADYAKMPGGWMNDPVGFTTPLLTDAAGNKFGKSEGNAVWLDALETTPFDLYGYFVQRPDAEVERLLMALTFMPLETIKTLVERHMQNPAERVAQHTLAFEMVSLIHGAEVAIREQRQHLALFGKSMVTMPDGTVPKNLERKYYDGSDVEANPNTSNGIQQTAMQLPRDLLMGKSIAKIMYACGLCESASAAQRLINNGGMYVAAAPGQMVALNPGSLDWTPVRNWFPSDTAKFLIDGKLLIVRRGKRNIRIIEMVEDDVWKASGQTYPGEPYTGRLRTVLNAVREKAEGEGKRVTNTEARRRLMALLEEEGNMSLDEKVAVKNNAAIEFPPENGADRWVQEMRDREQSRQDYRDRVADKKHDE